METNSMNLCVVLPKWRPRARQGTTSESRWIPVEFRDVDDTRPANLRFPRAVCGLYVLSLLTYLHGEHSVFVIL